MPKRFDPVTGRHDYYRKASSGGTPGAHTHPPADIIPQGSGSLLDSDLLDGLSSGSFALSGHSHSYPVTSVFGRTGAVVAALNDYTWAQIDKTISALADITTRPHSALTGIGANDHHAQQHAIDGADHTGSLAWAAINKTVSSLADITTRSHTVLSDIGTNTHATIDTHLGAAAPHSGHEVTSAKGAASGYCPLDASALVPDANIPAGITRDSELTTHAGLATGVHGAGASTLATVADISTHSGLSTGVHGAGASTLATTANIATHAALTASVHNFDISGNAPPQAHGSAAHTGTIGTWVQIDKTVSSLADLTTRSASDLSSGLLAVARGGTNLASGTSGGILGYTAAGVLASSVLLTASALVLGGGAGATPVPLGSLGTTTTVLHGNAAGAPTFAAVSLTADVSGILPILNGGSGQSTQQAAINALTAVVAATNEHVLTKDTATGNAIFKAVSGGANHAILSATHTDSTASAVARGSLVTGQGASPTWAQLVVGVNNQILKNDGTDVAWGKVDLADDTAEISGILAYNHGGTAQSAWAQGDLLYASAVNTLAKLTVGAVNTVLVSNGTIPGWSATLAGLTLTTPTISATGWTNANHSHQAANSGGQLDHQLACVAASLLDDDHTQYALLAGRGTGQTLIGGVNSGNSLTLQPNSVSGNTGYISLDGEIDLRNSLTSLAAFSTNNCVGFNSAVSTAGTGATLNAFNFSPTVTITNSNFAYFPIKLGGTFTFGAGSGSNTNYGIDVTALYNTGAAGITTIQPPAALVDRPTLRSSHTTATYLVGFTTVFSTPTFDALAGGTNFSPYDHYGFIDYPNYSAGVGRTNQFNRVGYWFRAPLAYGAGVNRYYGASALLVDDQTLATPFIPVAALQSAMNANSAYHYNLYCTGTAPSAHLGAAVFGAAAQPTNASTGLELQGTTTAFIPSRMTAAQRDTLTGIAVADGMMLYNSTINQLQGRTNGRWLSLPGWDVSLVKSANQVVTNNDTLQDDTELQFAVLANEVWDVELYLGMSGNDATGDGKVGFTAAAASFVVAQSNWDGVYYGGTGTLTTTPPTAFASTTQAVTGGTICLSGNGTVWPVRLRYRCRCSASTTLKVQFANAAALAGRTTTMHAGSMLLARRAIA